MFPLQRSGNLRGNAGIVFQQGDVGLQALAPGQFADVFEQKWGDGLAAYVFGLGHLQGLLNRRFDVFGRHGVLFRHRHADQHPARQAQLELGADDVRGVFCRVAARVDGQAAAARVERGESLRAEAQHGHAVRLQPFERERQIEDGLRARAHDDDGRLREFGQIGGHVERLAAMHAADAARGKDLDASLRGDPHRGGDGGRAMAFLRGHDGQIAAADFADVIGVRQPFKLIGFQPGVQLAVENGDGGRRRAVLAHHGLEAARHFEVDRARQAVRDQRRFERDNGRVRFERGADGSGEVKELGNLCHLI
jgi:hypothetical protein